MTRVNIEQIEAKAYKAMYALEGYLQTTGISPIHKHLIKIRASQLNGCAYCLDMHTKEAIKIGETLQRIFLISAWKEAESIFTKEEKAILALTEEVTLIHQHGLSDATYQKAESLFGKNLVAQLIMTIVTINAWNRIAVSTQLQP